MGMTAHIFKKNTTNNQLEVYIRELDYPQKEYEGFRVRLKGSAEWVYIPVENNNNKETSSIIFDNLQELKRYKISGQVNFNGNWINLQDATFVMQKYIPELPKIQKHKGSGVFVEERNSKKEMKKTFKENKSRLKENYNNIKICVNEELAK